MVLVGRSVGDVHQKALEELSRDVETVDMQSWWAWLWGCGQEEICVGS